MSLFTPKKILQNNVTEKKVAIEGELWVRQGTALIFLIRQCFPEKIPQLEKTIFSKDTKVECKKDNNNDTQSH